MYLFLARTQQPRQIMEGPRGVGGGGVYSRSPGREPVASSPSKAAAISLFIFIISTDAQVAPAVIRRGTGHRLGQRHKRRQAVDEPSYAHELTFISFRGYPFLMAERGCHED